jgi:uncharacterized membrane protein
VAVGAAAGATGYLVTRAVRRAGRPSRATRVDEDGGGRRSYLRAVTIYRPPADVYGFWRDLPNLGRALGHVVRVDEVDDERSRWIVEGIGGSEVEFMVELLIDEPERRLAWRADDAPVPHEGRLEFTPAPGGRGTEVRLYVTCLAAGAGAAPHTGDRLLYDALRRVKQIIEAGEVVTVEDHGSGPDGAWRRAGTAAVWQVAVGGSA